MIRILDLHVRRQHIGEAAHLPTAHRVRLSGDGERPHTRFADTSGSEVAVDDCIHLVAAARGLVDALAVDRDDPWRADEQIIELVEVELADAGLARHRADTQVARRAHRLAEPRRVPLDVPSIDRVGTSDLRQEAVEQRDVATRRNRQMHVRDLARRGAARIDHHDLCAALVAGRRQPLEQHGMAPREIRSDDNDEIGLLDVLVVARHGVRAERALVPGHG